MSQLATPTLGKAHLEHVRRDIEGAPHDRVEVGGLALSCEGCQAKVRSSEVLCPQGVLHILHAMLQEEVLGLRMVKGFQRV